MRRLTAILAADVVGYSRLMAEDEAGTLAVLREHRRTLFDPETGKRGGRTVKLMGDGVLVEFPSVVDAVECAVAVQAALAKSGGPLRLRMGVNLGDVIVEGDDIYGDGVNVAARLEALAEPGGICISGLVRESLGNRVAAAFADAGEHALKGMPRPVRVWRWVPEGAASSVAPAPAAPLALPEKPSVAILPFDNMSTDPEQQFFAEGIAEDIITELSKFRSLFVIARNSSFAFKGQALEAREIGRRLGVRYIVEGSVRRSGNRVRVTAQLIDAVDDKHLWAERYDRDLADIFAVQDEVTRAIVITIEPTLADSERQRARRKPPDSLDAWESYQRGLWHMYQFAPDEILRGIGFVEQAIARDPGFAAAQAGLALALYFKQLFGASPDRAADLDVALGAGRRAVMLDGADPFAHLALGRVNTALGEHDTAIRHFDRAIALNPSYAMAHFARAHSLWMDGRAAEALPALDEAMRLSPQDPMMWGFMATRAIALVMLARHDEAVDWARRSQELPNAGIHANLAELAALGHLGRTAEAAAALERARRVKPDLDLGFVRRISPVTDAVLQRFLGGLRAAGLPD